MNYCLGKLKTTHVTALSVRCATCRFRPWESKARISLPHLVFNEDILIKPLNNNFLISHVTSLFLHVLFILFLPKLR